MSPISVLETSRADYLAYLQTNAWRTTRNRALQLAHFRCHRCDSKRDLQVHHRTYERLGREWDQDLEVVCGSCHREEHITQALKSPHAIYLRLAMALHREEPFDSLTSLSEAVKVRCRELKIPIDPPHIHRALELVAGCVTFRDGERVVDRPTAEELYQQPIVAPPCSCEACVVAGVSTQRLRRDPRTGQFLHGDDLRRWYAARDAFGTRPVTDTFEVEIARLRTFLLNQ